MLLQLLLHRGLHPVIRAARLACGAEPDRDALGDVPGAQVGGHDDHRVLEVDHPALRIGEAPVLEDLQQRVEDVRVSLLDLVEQHHGERLAAHLLGQLAALLVSDVPGRRTQQPGHRVLLRVLAHVQLDQRVLIAEQEVRERPGQLRLADPGRAGEDERAPGPLRVLQPGPGPPDGLRERLDGHVLPDHPPVQLVFHPQQPLRFLLGQREHRDARGGRQDLRDQLRGHLGDGVHVAGLPLLLPGVLLPGQLLLGAAQGGGLLEVLGVDGRLLLPAEVSDLLVELAQARRGGHPADPQPGPGLIDQVDCLVRQEPVADVAVRELRGGDKGVVGERHAVMRLVAVAQAPEDLDGVRDRRLGHLDRLEPALQRRVLLQVLAVLIQRGRADRLQLAAGQHRLEDRGGVDRALGRARPDQRMQLVDEQDDVPARPDLLEDVLQPFLEVAPVPRAGHQRAQVQGVKLLVLDGLRHLALDDLLGQALHHSRLADAGLAHQHGVVLGAPGQHLHDPLDFLLPADHRIELALACGSGQVAAELVEYDRSGGRRLGRRACRGWLLALGARQQLDHLLADPAGVSAQLDEHLRGDAVVLADQAEQDMLGADVVVAQLQRLAQRQLKHLLDPRSERDMPGRCLLALAGDLPDVLADRLQADPQRLKGLGGDALALADQAEQDVLGADMVVVEYPGLFLSQDRNPPRPVGEPLEHLVAPSPSGRRGNRSLARPFAC